MTSRRLTRSLLAAGLSIVVLVLSSCTCIPREAPGYWPACEGLPGMIGDDC